MTFFRYTLVQLLAYGIDMGGFLVLLWAGLFGPFLANVLAKSAAGLFAFAAHRQFTFGTIGNGGTVGQGLRYFLLLALNVPLSSGLLALLLLWVPQAVVAKVLSDVVMVAVTYWASKLLVFRAAKSAARAES